MRSLTLDMDDGYFESMYRDQVDPWGFDSRFYERRKFDLTLAALTRPTYRNAYEPGCSNGALTERLARRCDRLTSCDIVDAVVQRARRRVRSFDHVSVLNDRFPEYWPDGSLDLVVWSEVSYYLTSTGLGAALSSLRDRLASDGELVVVNYTGDTNYPRTAGEVDAQIGATGWLRRRSSVRDDEFQLDVWTLLDSVG